MMVDSTSTQGTFLQGDKVQLRGIRHEDMESFRRWNDNMEATYFMETGWRPARDLDLDSVWSVSAEQEDNIVFTILDSESGKAIGTCGLYLLQWICRRAEFRIFIGEDKYHGAGRGTEATELILAYAFDHLNLETVYLGVNKENKQAIRSYEKAGFVSEGIRRQLVYRNGRYYDVLMMSILRKEYSTLKGNAL